MSTPRVTAEPLTIRPATERYGPVAGGRATARSLSRPV